MKSTKDCSLEIERMREALQAADAVLIGAGAGMSTSAGLTYSGERFNRYFSDFAKEYGITDMYSGGFYPFDSLEEYWAWWSRQIWYNRYDSPIGKPYTDLLRAIGDREYFVLTTNVDHQFQRAGFDKNRLFYTQGDYGLLQCSMPCHHKTYDNEKIIREMVLSQSDMRVPTHLIPHCPMCGKPMTVNLRADSTFVQDSGWYEAADRYEKFITSYRNAKIVMVELGVGDNTPSIIKYPFWEMTKQNSLSTYICINAGEAICPSEIASRAILIQGDIGSALEVLVGDEK